MASLELLEVPVANLHVAAVVVQALGEGLCGAGAVVSILLLLLVILLLVLLGSLGLHLLGRRSLFGRAAAEETTDGVADGGADSDTTTRESKLVGVECGEVATW